ncbi:hypothetical protein MRX96_016213 [Rhipicephalus microplus]
MSAMRGRTTRGRAASAGSRTTPRGTPPYFGQRQQRAEARPNDPLPEAGRAFIISAPFLRLPAVIVSKSGVTTYFIDECVIQESPQPFSSTTVATTTGVGGAQLCCRVRSMDAPSSTMPGTDPGTSVVVAVKRKPPQPLDSFFVETPAMTASLPGTATSTSKMTLKPKTSSLAYKKTEGLQTTPSKATSSDPGAAAASKSDLVHGMPPEVLSTPPRDSVASQASPALLTTPRQHQQEATYPLHMGITCRKSGRWMTWQSSFPGSQAASTSLKSSASTRLTAYRQGSNWLRYADATRYSSTNLAPRDFKDALGFPLLMFVIRAVMEKLGVQLRQPPVKNTFHDPDEDEDSANLALWRQQNETGYLPLGCATQ